MSAASTTGFTFTFTSLASVPAPGAAGTTVFDAARLKSSARCPTVPLVMTSGRPDGNCMDNVSWLLAPTNGAVVTLLEILPLATVRPPLPLSTRMPNCWARSFSTG